MKNRIILGAIVASVCLFALCLNNMKRYESVTSTISRNQNNTQTVTKKNKQGRKQGTSPVLEKITKKGNSKLASQIQKAMKNSNNYDVKVLDLKNSNSSTEVYSKKDKINVSDSLKAFLLVELYKEIEQQKVKVATTLTPTASEIVKGDSTPTANIVYSLVYVQRNLMSKSSSTATNLLLDKLGKEQVSNIIKGMGTCEAVISSKFGESVVGTTSAGGLTILMKSLYNGKFLGSYSNTVLAGLSTYSVESPLVDEISNASIIQMKDSTSTVALVTTDKHSYVIAVTSQNNNSFVELGLRINTWFSRN